MRKIGIIMALVFLGVTLGVSDGNGQVTVKPGFGINITNWSEEPDGVTSTGNVGWQIGGTVAFGKKVFFEPGFFYQERSTEVSVYNEAEGAANYEFDNAISSIRIPLNIGFNLIGEQGDIMSLYAFGGPTASIVTSVEDSEFLDVDDYKDINWGVQLGAGLNVAIFYLDASYEWGLNDFLEDMDESVKLQGFYLTGGLKF